MAATKPVSAVKPKWRQSLPFQADYNDHFETPSKAYQDILPLLDWLMLPATTTTISETSQQRQRNYCVYDPYYCNGKAAILLKELGFENVIHAPRDFYKDIEQDQVPDYDVLVTNPPYSDQHKEDCLKFCFQQLRNHGKPFFILMPNYVAARSYYREQLYANKSGNNDNNTNNEPAVEDVCYVIPTHAYEYQHPEGTGHDIPPFASLWFCGIGRDRVQQVRQYWVEHQKDSHSVDGSKHHPRLAVSVNELQQWNAIPTTKRPNPRQRRKRQQLQQKQQYALPESEDPRTSGAPSTRQKAVSANKSSGTSKYRNKKGQRGRKRF